LEPGARVVLLGDLVDAWWGPGQWREAALLPLATALRGLLRRGGEFYWVRGNRDVLLEAGDLAGIGGVPCDALLYAAPQGPLLLSHGDEYCTRDRSYQRLRRLLRNRFLRLLLRALPYRLRRWIACGMRGGSRRAVARKPLSTLALDDSAVEDACSEVGARGALIGHLHAPQQRELGSGISLTVLPAWRPGAAPWLPPGPA